MLFRRFVAVTAASALFMVIVGGTAVAVLLIGASHKPTPLLAVFEKAADILRGVTDIVASNTEPGTPNSTFDYRTEAKGAVAQKVAKYASEVRINVGDTRGKELEQVVFRGINEARTSRYAPPLQWDETLAQAARARAREIVETQWIGIGHRLRRTGLTVPGFGEISADGVVSETIRFAGSIRHVGSAPEGWINSLRHRYVVMNPEWRYVGVGVVWLDRPLHIGDEEDPNGIDAEAVVVALYRR